MPTVTCPMPDQESSQERSAWSARSYEGREHPVKPTAARRSWPRWSVMRYSITWSARSSTDGGIVSPRALAVLTLITNPTALREVAAVADRWELLFQRQLCNGTRIGECHWRRQNDEAPVPLGMEATKCCREILVICSPIP